MPVPLPTDRALAGHVPGRGRRSFAHLYGSLINFLDLDRYRVFNSGRLARVVVGRVIPR